ncbi:hypothetical protein Ddye_016697 [Dipteronia dyeriana]|uniref:Uncharacterized protein n=1 Tax=Dipteronia dyeriana TaxID=168575 RepID=A0AAD9U7Z1_9ROSI|nr:hypothetical protein Ddye_016697 [Dipteronia dyeriana]
MVEEDVSQMGGDAKRSRRDDEIGSVSHTSTQVGDDGDGRVYGEDSRLENEHRILACCSQLVGWPDVMKIFSWNVRGLGTDRMFRVLQNHKHNYNPNEMFLMETMVGHARFEKLQVLLGYAGKIVVDSVGRSFGLCMFWSENVDVVLLSYSQGHVDVQVRIHQAKVWCLTGFYGHLERSKRCHSWTLLRHLAGVWKKIQELESRLNSCMEIKESYWWHWSRIEWLWSGDKNTKNFHMKASVRKSSEHGDGIGW